jgi:hypothetical protein
MACTVVTFRARSACHDVARVLGFTPGRASGWAAADQRDQQVQGDQYKLMVGRLMPVTRAMPRCETRSRCSFSTSSILMARSRAQSSVTVETPHARQ